jgi:hypothetical protein
MSVGSGSRMPTLIEALERANRGGDQTILKNIIERAADPRDFLSDPDRLQAVVEHLNARLAYDGLELQRVGAQVRLGTPGMSSSVVGALLVLLRHNFSSSVSRSIRSATRTSRLGFDNRVDQPRAHGCDGIRHVAFRPQGRIP